MDQRNCAGRICTTLDIFLYLLSLHSLNEVLRMKDWRNVALNIIILEWYKKSPVESKIMGWLQNINYTEKKPPILRGTLSNPKIFLLATEKISISSF